MHLNAATMEISFVASVNVMTDLWAPIVNAKATANHLFP